MYIKKKKKKIGLCINTSPFSILTTHIFITDSAEMRESQSESSGSETPAEAEDELSPAEASISGLREQMRDELAGVNPSSSGTQGKEINCFEKANAKE